ncbi:DUF3579 domain-containing protein [Marinihelvus fidelis]|uniref:DUF3579 domain-containing protein n=1 Tax=Marinihelvus fidelis TaxID=2613842 RepID=A0A5N0TGJ9_9GAMM|nr:DUF3579 domain-containing protein [Marinihelvus fidelis]KAA9134180.1 DUF3579 domain-containing protein [Marinihelvus fidelis]
MEAHSIYIIGTTHDGRRFRPSDWTERLYYAVANYDRNGRIAFNPLLSVKMKNDARCIVVDMRLRDTDPITFSFVTEFARDNALQTFDQDDRPVCLH